MIPITRKELYLNKIVGNDDYGIPEKPITTEEFFFAEILGEAVQAPEPLTRYQMYLAKIAGRNIEIPTPITRLEFFLAKACGMDIETPTPITREEIYWSNYTAIVEFELEGVPPLTYKAIEGTLENYRIYGNTVDGESVGDRTGNLWDGTVESNCYIDKTTHQIVSGSRASDTSNFIAVEPNTIYTFSFNKNTPYSFNARIIAFYTQTKEWLDFTEYYVRIDSSVNITIPNNCYYIRITIDKAFSGIMLNAGSTALPYEPYGYKVPVTVEGKNLVPNTATSQTINDVAFTVNSDRSVTCNGTATKTAAYILNNTFSLEPGTYNLTGCPAGGGYVDKYKLDVVVSPIVYGTDTGDGLSFTLSSTLTNALYRIIIYAGQTCNNLTFYPMIRKADITDDTYEPYHAPVTTPIYLPEPIKMVGDEAEYIDYGEQKMHRIGAEDINVILPELPMLAGTNVLTVGTAVQPSKVYIKGKKERE